MTKSEIYFMEVNFMLIFNKAVSEISILVNSKPSSPSFYAKCSSRTVVLKNQFNYY